MSAYKIVGVFTKDTQQWFHGKIGTQAKKRVYVSREDFRRYAPETANRWKKFIGLAVEAYEMVSGKWVKCVLPKELKK